MNREMENIKRFKLILIQIILIKIPALKFWNILDREEKVNSGFEVINEYLRHNWGLIMES